MNLEEIDKVTDFANEMGVKLDFIPGGVVGGITGFYPAPFSNFCGIDWGQKIFVLNATQTNIGEAIHEVGHLVATSYEPNDDRLCELDFLGWEIAAALKLGCLDEWFTFQADYNLEDEDYEDEQGNTQTVYQIWQVLEKGVKDQFISRYLTKAKQDGLVDEKGNLLTVR